MTPTEITTLRANGVEVDLDTRMLVNLVGALSETIMENDGLDHAQKITAMKVVAGIMILVDPENPGYQQAIAERPHILPTMRKL